MKRFIILCAFSTRMLLASAGKGNQQSNGNGGNGNHNGWSSGGNTPTQTPTPTLPAYTEPNEPTATDPDMGATEVPFDGYVPYLVLGVVVYGVWSNRKRLISSTGSI